MSNSQTSISNKAPTACLSNAHSVRLYHIRIHSMLPHTEHCFLGMLIRRWGILWRPLEMKFGRRTAVVTACMRLHNFCIDKRIETNFRVNGGLSEFQPNRWGVAPKEDKDGRPLERLKTKRGLPLEDAPAPPGDRYSRRDELIELVNDAALKRPKTTHSVKKRKASL